MQSWEIRFLAIELPKVRRCADETWAIASACPAGEGPQQHHVHERAYPLVAGCEINISGTPAA